MQFLKKNLLTVIIVIATVILAGVAIFTAIRLYQLRNQAVAPNAPTSKPGAASSACTVSFNISTPTPTPTTPPSCGTTCTDTTNSSDCPTGMTCTTVGASNVCRNTSCTAESSCICATATPTATATATPTPTPTTPPSCGSTCTDTVNSSDCPTGMSCTAVGTTNVCRNTSCTSESNCICATATPTVTPTATPTTTPTATPLLTCGNSCTSSSQCGNGMSCIGNLCKNPSCSSSANCICATATATATSTAIAQAATPTTTPSLPQAGTSWPTILGVGAGIAVTLLGILLAL